LCKHCVKLACLSLGLSHNFRSPDITSGNSTRKKPQETTYLCMFKTRIHHGYIIKQTSSKLLRRDSSKKSYRNKFCSCLFPQYNLVVKVEGVILKQTKYGLRHMNFK
jgi:hypothetical protein